MVIEKSKKLWHSKFVHNEQKKPLVSIILPTYNRAHILRRAIESVLSQSFRDFELIIVDDGSQDTTKEVVDSFQDARIRYVRHEKNRGLAASRNTGAHAARGTYVANQDSDDVWLPGKLEREVAILENSPQSLGVAYSRIKKTFGDGHVELVPSDNEDTRRISGNIYERMLEGNIITMQASLMRKECFDAVGGFDESLLALQDWDFWIRVSRRYEFAYISVLGVEATISSDSITAQKLKRLKAREYILHKHAKAFRTYPAVYAHHAFRIGHAYALRGEMKQARAHFWQALHEQARGVYIAAFLASLWGKRIYRIVSSFV